MFYRNAIVDLKRWAEKEKRKPLILRGARQVGKTTLVDEFSKEFDVYLKLNLEKSIDHGLFERNLNINDLITAIYLLNNKPKIDGRTLLFIDEIQNSPKAVEQLRYFYEEVPNIHVIAAGSLLETLIDKQISFPVGRVEYMAIRPCSFNEFLGAIGEVQLKKAHAKAAIPEVLHDKVMRLFNTYTLIGGMPEVISEFSKKQDIVALQDIYETLLTGYQDDVEKYSDSDTMRNILRHILSAGWAYAAQRITFERFGNSNYRSREMGEAFRTLEKTMLLELVYPVTSTVIPIKPEPRRSPKLLWLDTGLVNYSVGLQKELFGVMDISDAWRGLIAEHIIGQELLTTDNRVSHKRSFWVRDAAGSSAEVDYIVQLSDKVIPIEVKSGNNSKLKSLHQFMEQAPHSTAIRFWTNHASIDKVKTPSGKEFLLYNLPYYYGSKIQELVDVR
ncbi:AAA family ATPase [Alistipes sp. OttesenSCG-928-B03]|nr:AAA family ATPase [Alistipes sp. OttesenSCG-928-B03]